MRRPDVSSSDGSIAVGGNLGSASTTHIGTQVLGVSSMPVAAAVKDPQAVYTAVGLDRFTGQVWLAGEVDRFVAANPCGYVFIEAEAGLGKTAFAAWLVSTRGYLSHFSRLGYSLNRSKLPGMDQPRAVSEAEELLITRAGRRLHMSAVMLVRSITAVHRRSACASYTAACCAKVSITVRCHSGSTPGQKAPTPQTLSSPDYARRVAENGRTWTTELAAGVQRQETEMPVGGVSMYAYPSYRRIDQSGRSWRQRGPRHGDAT